VIRYAIEDVFKDCIMAKQVNVTMLLDVECVRRLRHTMLTGSTGMLMSEVHAAAAEPLRTPSYDADIQNLQNAVTMLKRKQNMHSQPSFDLHGQPQASQGQVGDGPEFRAASLTTSSKKR